MAAGAMSRFGSQLQREGDIGEGNIIYQAKGWLFSHKEGGRQVLYESQPHWVVAPCEQGPGDDAKNHSHHLFTFL